MAVLGRLVVDGVRQVELLDNYTGPQIEVLMDDLHQLVGALGAGAVRLDKDAEWLCNADGIRQLHQAATGEFGEHEGFGDPSCEIGGRTIDLGVVLAREGTPTVSAPTAVGVDNNFSAC